MLFTLIYLLLLKKSVWMLLYCGSNSFLFSLILLLLLSFFYVLVRLVPISTWIILQQTLAYYKFCATHLLCKNLRNFCIVACRFDSPVTTRPDSCRPLLSSARLCFDEGSSGFILWGKKGDWQCLKLFDSSSQQIKYFTFA